MNKNFIFPLVGPVPACWPVRSGAKRFFILMTTILMIILLGVLVASCSIYIGSGSPGPTTTAETTATVQPSANTAGTTATVQPPANDRLLRFSGDRNTDSQTLGVRSSDLLQRALSGDGWQVDNETFKV